MQNTAVFHGKVCAQAYRLPGIVLEAGALLGF